MLNARQVELAAIFNREAETTVSASQGRALPIRDIFDAMLKKAVILWEEKPMERRLIERVLLDCGRQWDAKLAKRNPEVARHELAAPKV